MYGTRNIFCRTKAYESYFELFFVKLAICISTLVINPLFAIVYSVFTPVQCQHTLRDIWCQHACIFHPKYPFWDIKCCLIILFLIIFENYNFSLICILRNPWNRFFRQRNLAPIPKISQNRFF